MAEHASRDEVTTNLDLSHGFPRWYKMRPTQFERKERMESGGAKRRKILRREREREREVWYGQEREKQFAKEHRSR